MSKPYANVIALSVACQSSLRIGYRQVLVSRRSADRHQYDRERSTREDPSNLLDRGCIVGNMLQHV
jgi:hypothetical protein